MENTTTQMSDSSRSLFMALARDAGNWNGYPMVSVTKEQRGNLTDLKKRGLLTTFNDDGIDWVQFTQAGYQYGKDNGIEICRPL